jgi:hypothetical protein
MLMTFVNGELQARFMTRVRGLDPQRCLAVPVDVGKAVACGGRWPASHDRAPGLAAAGRSFAGWVGGNSQPKDSCHVTFRQSPRGPRARGPLHRSRLSRARRALEGSAHNGLNRNFV